MPISDLSRTINREIADWTTMYSFILDNMEKEKGKQWKKYRYKRTKGGCEVDDRKQPSDKEKSRSWNSIT